MLETNNDKSVVAERLLYTSYTHICSFSHWSIPEGVVTSVFKDEVTEAQGGGRIKTARSWQGRP